MRPRPHTQVTSQQSPNVPCEESDSMIPVPLRTHAHQLLLTSPQLISLPWELQRTYIAFSLESTSLRLPFNAADSDSSRRVVVATCHLLSRTKRARTCNTPTERQLVIAIFQRVICVIVTIPRATN